MLLGWCTVVGSVAACSGGDRSAAPDATSSERAGAVTTSVLAGEPGAPPPCGSGPFVAGHVVTGPELETGCRRPDGSRVATAVWSDCVNGATFFENDFGYGFVGEPFVASDRAGDPYVSGCYVRAAGE